MHASATTIWIVWFILSFVHDNWYLAHGGWSPWTTYRECSASCNGGTQTRTRTCTNPPPLKGGQLCLDKNQKPSPVETEQKICNTKVCPRKYWPRGFWTLKDFWWFGWTPANRKLVYKTVFTSLDKSKVLLMRFRGQWMMIRPRPQPLKTWLKSWWAFSALS